MISETTEAVAEVGNDCLLTTKVDLSVNSKMNSLGIIEIDKLVHVGTRYH